MRVHLRGASRVASGAEIRVGKHIDERCQLALDVADQTRRRLVVVGCRGMMLEHMAHHREPTRADGTGAAFEPVGGRVQSGTVMHVDCRSQRGDTFSRILYEQINQLVGEFGRRAGHFGQHLRIEPAFDFRFHR